MFSEEDDTCLDAVPFASRHLIPEEAESCCCSCFWRFVFKTAARSLLPETSFTSGGSNTSTDPSDISSSCNSSGWICGAEPSGNMDSVSFSKTNLFPSDPSSSFPPNGFDFAETWSPTFSCVLLPFGFSSSLDWRNDLSLIGCSASWESVLLAI